MMALYFIYFPWPSVSPKFSNHNILVFYSNLVLILDAYGHVFLPIVLLCTSELSHRLSNRKFVKVLLKGKGEVGDRRYQERNRSPTVVLNHYQILFFIWTTLTALLFLKLVNQKLTRNWWVVRGYSSEHKTSKWRRFHLCDVMAFTVERQHFDIMCLLGSWTMKMFCSLVAAGAVGCFSWYNI